MPESVSSAFIVSYRKGSNYLRQVETSSLALGQQSGQVLGPDGDGEGGQHQGDHLVGHPCTLHLHLPSLPLSTGLPPLAGGADEQQQRGNICSNNAWVQGNRSASPQLRRPGHQYPTFVKLPMVRIEEILFLMIYLYNSFLEGTKYKYEQFVSII